MKLSLNREYAVRHLGVALLFLGLGGWFAKDAIFTYPQTSAHDLYVSIEKAEPQKGFDLEAFKRQKIQSQYGFLVFLALAAAIIAGRVGLNHLATLEWDDEKMWGSLTCGRPLAFADVEKVDDSRWARKGILVLTAKDGRRVTLDTWHHAGAEELAKRFLKPAETPAGDA